MPDDHRPLVGAGTPGEPTITGAALPNEPELVGSNVPDEPNLAGAEIVAPQITSASTGG